MKRVLPWFAALLLCAAWHQQVRAQVPDRAAGYQRLYTRIVAATWPGAPVASLAAQIHQESAWDCTAVSRVGARGCAQVMPATGDWLAEKFPTLARGLVNDPAWAFEAQARYMRFLFERVTGETECERLAFAMAAYNGGEKRVRQRKALSRAPEVCFRVTCPINPGISPANQRENEEYPVRILKTIDTRYRAWGRDACG